MVIKQCGELDGAARDMLAEIAEQYEEMYGIAHASTMQAQVDLAGCLATLGLNDVARAAYAAAAAHYLPGIHPWFKEAAEQPALHNPPRV